MNRPEPPVRRYGLPAGWVTALRIARRETRHAKGRSALVVALIGLPMLGLSFAAVTYDSFRLTTEQTLDREMGTAAAALRWDYRGPIRQDPTGLGTSGGDFREEPATAAELRALLPAGSRVVPREEGPLDLRTAAGVGTLEATALDLTDPITDGMVELLAGRAPGGVDEVAVTRQAADRLGAGLGGSVSTVGEARTFTVVGIVEFPGSLTEIVVFAPDALPEGDYREHTWLLAAPPVTWEQVQELNRAGVVVRSRAVLLDPPPASRLAPEFRFDPQPRRELAVGALIAGLALLEVVLLAGPAFAVGARRRQRELALIAAAGGTPAQQRRIVLADGVVLGGIGAVVGIALGVGLALAARPLLEEYLWQARAGGYRFFPLALLGIAALAVLVGLAAAVVPATVAARQPVVSALSGRRGVTRSRRRWLALGLILTAAGGATAAWGAWRVSSTLVLTGLVLGEFGLVLCTPALVGLIARVGRWVPLAGRIALRDTARNRAAAAPAISAVMAAVAGSLAIGIFLASDQARNEARYLPSLPTGAAAVQYEWWAHSGPDDPGRRVLPAEQQESVQAAIRTALSPERLHQVVAPACPPGDSAYECGVYVPLPAEHMCPAWELPGELTEQQQREAAADERCRYEARYGHLTFGSGVVDDGTLLPVLTQAAGEELAAARAALRAGEVVVTDPLLLRDGRATLITYRSQLDDDPVEEPVTVAGHAVASQGPDLVFVPPAVLAETGLTSQTVAVIAETDAPPGQATRDALTAVLRDIEPELNLYVEDGPPGGSDPRLLVLAGAAAVVTLGAAGIATGLAAADRRTDLSTLAAVGASPRVRRLLSLQHTGVIAGLGTLLGTLAGVGAAFAVLFALNQRETVIWPPPTLYPLEVPWPALAVLLTVPLVAMLGAGLFTRSRLPIERRPG